MDECIHKNLSKNQFNISVDDEEILFLRKDAYSTQLQVYVHFVWSEFCLTVVYFHNTCTTEEVYPGTALNTE